MQLLRTVCRLFRSSTTFVSLLWHWRSKRQLEPKQLLLAFERLGATYIKLGQFIASAPSLFPPDYVAAFQACLDHATPVPFRVVERALERELARPLSECFADIDPKPLASASIAQVHAARLHDGTHVVLKVQRPRILSTLRADLTIIKMLIRLVQYFYPVVRRANLLLIAQDMERKFHEECDFKLEAERIKKFADFLQRFQVKIVIVPRVYDELTTAQLLVMDRLQGEPYTKQMRFSGSDPSASLQLTLQVWLMSVAECEFFHADVHGGNLLWLPDGRVGLIDFGIVDSIDRQDWQAAVDCIESLQVRNMRRVAAAMVRLGAASRVVNEQQLTIDLTQSFANLWSTQSPLVSGNADHKISTALSDFCGIAERHNLRFPTGFFLLLRQYLYFERYIQLAAPAE